MLNETTFLGEVFYPSKVVFFVFFPVVFFPKIINQINKYFLQLVEKQQQQDASYIKYQLKLTHQTTDTNRTLSN